jgi:hypothetical protein
MTTPIDLAIALLAYLDGQIALCEAAPNGPWGPRDDRFGNFLFAGSDVVCVADGSGPAATFIAAARTGYPAVLGQVRQLIRNCQLVIMAHQLNPETVIPGSLESARVLIEDFARAILPPDQLAALGEQP